MDLEHDTAFLTKDRIVDLTGREKWTISTEWKWKWSDQMFSKSQTQV